MQPQTDASLAGRPNTAAAFVVIAGQEWPVGTYDPDGMTFREPQRSDEQAAKQLVQLCLPEVEVCLHDDGSRDMLYDLELRWPDGRVEAMEVTTDTDEVWQLVGSRLDREGPVMAVESAHSWVVLLAEGNTEVRSVRARIDHLLSLVEQAGRTRISRREERGSLAVARVRRLGVDYGYTYEAADGQPKIRIMLPMRWWWTRPEAVNEAVERHAELNAAKLAPVRLQRAAPVHADRARFDGGVEWADGARASRGAAAASGGGHYRVGGRLPERRAPGRAAGAPTRSLGGAAVVLAHQGTGRAQWVGEPNPSVQRGRLTWW